MTRKAAFNAEEWATIVNGPLYAGMRVIHADHGGTIRESLAMGRVYQEARDRHGASQLLDEIVASPPALDPERLGVGGQNLAAVTTAELARAVDLLAGTALAAEVDDYKRFVMTVAQAVAGAHKEGGFLGIGGTSVSDAENDALDEIFSALGSPPAS